MTTPDYVYHLSAGTTPVTLSVWDEETASGDIEIECLVGNETIQASGDDYFEALCAARVELEKRGLLLECYGASLNHFPTGMAASMGGSVTYLLRPGRSAHEGEAHDIFATGPDVVPATVADQEAAFDAWSGSVAKEHRSG